jgi:hypothetical protein
MLPGFWAKRTKEKKRERGFLIFGPFGDKLIKARVA